MKKIILNKLIKNIKIFFYTTNWKQKFLIKDALHMLKLQNFKKNT